MPEKRGRKRRQRDRGARDSEPVAASAPAPATQPAAPAPAVPSNTARATGFAIAVITMFLAIGMIVDAFSADRATIDAVVRVLVGVFLVLLGIVVAALSLFPAQVRKMVRGV